jgi:glutamate/tyrosine decarboxylase-like PLP-dependent enzyme
MSFDLHREPLEEAARQATELFLEIYGGLESRRVDPGANHDELQDLFRDTLTDEGVGLIQALHEFRDRVLPNSMGTAHPLYLGLVNSSPFPAAALADLLVSSLNNNGGAFHQSPAMTAAEHEVVRVFARLFRFPEPYSGMLLPGGSIATLQALVLARARSFPSWQTDGPTTVEGQPLLYTSQAAHFSVHRSAITLGLGRDGVVALAGSGRGEIDVAALEERIDRDRKRGGRPFAVVATTGTTGTGAIDPLSPIADLCEREGLWLHVDACYGGAALLLDELKARFDGIEHADSIAVDPHKWFFIPVTAALLLTRDVMFERGTFAIGDTSYIPQHGGVDAFLRGIPTSRRSSGLTVWMGLRAHGLSAVREAVRSNIELTRLLERLLGEGGFVVLPGGELSIACARWEGSENDSDEIDRLQQRIAAEVVESGEAWFSTTRHEGKTWLRFNLVNLHTREKHIRHLAGLAIETARNLAGR